jgi:glycosyltransferase involved in cell wall biosynthesis
LIFTNNGSTDSSVTRILAIREEHPWVQLITLSRNFGYHASLMSGLVNAMGDLLVIIDVDCEDPPELIPVFLKVGKRETISSTANASIAPKLGGSGRPASFFIGSRDGLRTTISFSTWRARHGRAG